MNNEPKILTRVIYFMLKIISFKTLFLFVINLTIFSCTIKNSGQAPSLSDTPGTPPQNPSGAGKVLLFIPFNNVWWAEYKVLYEGLTGLGYEVEVRSSSIGQATSYQTDTNIEISANSVAQSSYATFSQYFQSATGRAWNASWNSPATIPVTGRIQDVTSMSDYVAFVATGGVGAMDYFYDGTYSVNSNSGANISSASEVQAASEKINALIYESLQAGKPVWTQCHGARLSSFARVPGTQGSGFDNLGVSLMQGREATGFHLDSGSATDYAQLGVTYRSSQRVVIDGPTAAQMGGSESGRFKVVTTRDWYPQTVLLGVQAVHNILRSYPTQSQLSQTRQVLIIHGGVVNLSNCSAVNKTTNDIPCNYGTGANTPADYVDLQNLLSTDSAADPYSMNVSQVDIMSGAALPFDKNSVSSMLAYFSNFHSIVFFKHWNTGMTTALENALIQYADSGKGLVALHHGLYNDSDSKSILAAAFSAQSSSVGWGARNPDTGAYGFMNVNHGHFINSFALS
jgi:putative intracellular protease/amidase